MKVNEGMISLPLLSRLHLVIDIISRIIMHPGLFSPGWGALQCGDFHLGSEVSGTGPGDSHRLRGRA